MEKTTERELTQVFDLLNAVAFQPKRFETFVLVQVFQF
jgi:hypothetical protein